MAEIMRFRKRPITVEAVRWTGDNEAQVAEFAGGRFNAVDPEDRAGDPDITAEVLDELHSTWVGVKTGQWVVKGVRGEFYPVDDGVLRETFEPADAGPDAPSGTEFAVFWGGADPGDCAGWDLKDGEAEAEEDARWRVGGGVARREMFYGPWEVTVAPEMTGCSEPHSPGHRCFDCATDEELATSIPPYPAIPAEDD